MISTKNMIRATAMLAALALLPSLAQAQTRKHPIGPDSNMRFAIGNGLVIPASASPGATPAPNGRVEPAPGAVVTQAIDGSSIRFEAGAFVYDDAENNSPVYVANTSVYQVLTDLVISWPNAAVTMNEGGRQGANTVTWCPGDVVTSSGNPACAAPANGLINGLMRYTRTSNQIGGVGVASVGGNADVALAFIAGKALPCTGGVNGSNDPNCRAVFALATPDATGLYGASFGASGTTPGATPSSGDFYVTVNGPNLAPTTGETFSLGGKIVGIDTVNPQGPGASNVATTYGAPWTGGQLVVSVTANFGADVEKFTMTGIDTRTADGAGTLSLVTGTVSDRASSGPNANRGWLNMTIGRYNQLLPALSPQAGVAVMGLLGLAGYYVARRRS